MPHVPATAKTLALAHSRAVSWGALSFARADIPGACSALEKRPGAYRDSEWAQLCIAVHATGRVEPAWGSLRGRSCGCSLPAQPSRAPRRGQRVLVFPLEAFGKPELAR